MMMIIIISSSSSRSNGGGIAIAITVTITIILRISGVAEGQPREGAKGRQVEDRPQATRERQLHTHPQCNVFVYIYIYIYMWYIRCIVTYLFYTNYTLCLYYVVYTVFQRCFKRAYLYQTRPRSGKITTMYLIMGS